MPRNQCKQCRNFDEGRVDDHDKSFYCLGCWATFEGRSTTAVSASAAAAAALGVTAATPEQLKAHQARTQQPVKKSQTFNASATAEKERAEKKEKEKEKEAKAAANGPKNVIQGSSTGFYSKQRQAEGSSSAGSAESFSRLKGLLDLCGSGATAKAAAMPMVVSPLDLFKMDRRRGGAAKDNDGASSAAAAASAGGSRHHTLLNDALRPSRPVNPVCHDGSLSPRQKGAAGVSRSSAFFTARDNKVQLDMFLLSADDLVSQVYVNFDEDVTKAIINALDRVARAETGNEKERAKVVAVDELVQLLGEQHYALIRCLCDKARDVLLRLLAEFCSLDDLEDNGHGSVGHYGATVRFVPAKGQADGKKKKAYSEDEKWLETMNRRFKQLTESNQLDKFLRQDLMTAGTGSLPTNATVTKTEESLIFNLPPPVCKVLPQEKRIAVETELPPWTHPAFINVTHLNTIQTEVFQTAFHSSENMLICAPTGAGKTMVALLVMLRAIQKQFVDGKIDMDFKIIYVAPMKALAQEMVTNFGKRLAAFNIAVRELTGDMQLTKKEIMETQVIVTTPEKWDVVTRKPDNETARNVKLIIMDEIHLLNDDRGPVIEAIVARTHRILESESASGEGAHIRLVGLSATLPNYKDVATFLHVDLATGLKVFGAEYRPVPLEQTFVAVYDRIPEAPKPAKAIVGKDGKPKAARVVPARERQEKALDEASYKEVIRNLEEGHQVMVFVHARKQTINLASTFLEMAAAKGHSALFRPRESLPPHIAKKGHSLQGKELTRLFAGGIVCHHAGLIRYDRTSVEDLFRDGYARVIVCTSTLAWGVNLPAHCVVIRGTQIYDPKRGGLVSMSVLDVMQIFGRAGRPQFDTSGHGIIISNQQEITHFLRLMAHALPIESKMQNRLCDHLNAEIHSGTISSISDAQKWIEYTYMWRRMTVNPLVYGLTIHDVRKDPKLVVARKRIIADAAKDLAEAGMVRYSPATGSLDTTDIGRIASHYYIEHISIRNFNDLMRRDDGSWRDVIDMGMALNIIASANEFSQLRMRMDELDDLQKIHSSLPKSIQKERIVGDSADETGVQWKVTTLIKAYVSRVPVDSHSLVSDINYVVQNAGRITRALFEIEVQRAHPHSASTFLTICKSLERRVWENEHPLVQFEYDFPDSVLGHLRHKKPSMSLLEDMSPKDIGVIVSNQRVGAVIYDLVKCFPAVEIAAEVQPITRTILRVKATVTPTFNWNQKYHGGAEHFWIFVEDDGNNFIFHQEQLILRKKDVTSGTPTVINLTIPIVPEYDMYTIRIVSDRWLKCEDRFTFSVAHLHLPDDAPPTTKLLPLRPLGRDVLPQEFHPIYQSFTQLNPVQTQVFHTLFHTDHNCFLGAPTGSGKTLCSEMSVLRVLTMYRDAKIVYIAPLKALVKERMKDWGSRFDKILGHKVVELTGDVTPDLAALASARILCTTPEKWDGISRNWQSRSYVQSVKLVIFDEIHMLGNDRGPILEVIVSRMRYIGWHRGSPIRLVGLSTAVANPGDLGAWLGVDKKFALYNFESSVRPVPMRVHIAGYPGRHYCPRMATMNKPTYNAIVEKSPTQPVIVFVSSRRQTRLTALALINFLMLENNTARFVRMTVEEVQATLAGIEDPHLKHCVQFGIGIHHAGLPEGDKAIVEDIFRSGKLQILVATSTLAWGVNFPAHMVVVKGTEFYDAKTKSYIDLPITDVLQMIGRAGRPQFDNEGIAQVLCHEPKKGFYRKFLYDPFPVESALHKQLTEHINAEIVSGTIATRQDAVDYLTWTFLFRRLVKNPSFYGLEDPTPKALTVYLSQLVKKVLQDLEDARCIDPPDEEEGGDPNLINYTVLGKLCSYYYLSHKTAQFFDNNISPNADHVTLLRLMTEAVEFAELPVRHAEDKLNLELAQSCPLPIEARNADSPHVKAFLLFQAHFGRCPLPISDYHTDQRSAMDNSVRVLQAMVDVAANSGHLYAALKIMNLLQCMVQARWWHDSTLLQLPHVTEAMVSEFAAIGVTQIAHLANASRHVMAATERLLARPSHGLTDVQRDEVLFAIRRLPLVEVHLSLAKSVEEETEEFAASVSYTLHVELTRLSLMGKYVVAPHFSKQKDEQYWVIVGNEATGELVAQKRLNRLGRHSSVALTFDFDDDWLEALGADEGDEVPLQVYIVCDSFLGLDQQYTINVNGVIDEE